MKDPLPAIHEAFSKLDSTDSKELLGSLGTILAGGRYYSLARVILPWGVTLLTRQLSWHDGQVQRKAARILGEIAKGGEIENLSEAGAPEKLLSLVKEGRSGVSGECARSLGWFLMGGGWELVKPEELVPALTGLLASADPHDQGAAAWVLGLLAEKGFLDPGSAAKACVPLSSILSRSDEYARGQASWALSKIGDRSSIPYLEPLLEDKARLKLRLPDGAELVDPVGKIAEAAIVCILKREGGEIPRCVSVDGVKQMMANGEKEPLISLVNHPLKEIALTATGCLELMVKDSQLSEEHWKPLVLGLERALKNRKGKLDWNYLSLITLLAQKDVVASLLNERITPLLLEYVRTNDFRSTQWDTISTIGSSLSKDDGVDPINSYCSEWIASLLMTLPEEELGDFREVVVSPFTDLSDLQRRVIWSAVNDDLIRNLISYLENPSSTRRELTLVLLEHCPVERTIRSLEETGTLWKFDVLLEDGDPGVRLAALALLSTILSHQPRPQLVKELLPSLLRRLQEPYPQMNIVVLKLIPPYCLTEEEGQYLDSLDGFSLVVSHLLTHSGSELLQVNLKTVSHLLERGFLEPLLRGGLLERLSLLMETDKSLVTESLLLCFYMIIYQGRGLDDVEPASPTRLFQLTKEMLIDWPGRFFYVHPWNSEMVAASLWHLATDPRLSEESRSELFFLVLKLLHFLSVNLDSDWLWNVRVYKEEEESEVGDCYSHWTRRMAQSNGIYIEIARTLLEKGSAGLGQQIIADLARFETILEGLFTLLLKIGEEGLWLESDYDEPMVFVPLSSLLPLREGIFSLLHALVPFARPLAPLSTGWSVKMARAIRSGFLMMDPQATPWVLDRKRSLNYTGFLLWCLGELGGDDDLDLFDSGIPVHDVSFFLPGGVSHESTTVELLEEVRKKIADRAASEDCGMDTNHNS